MANQKLSTKEKEIVKQFVFGVNKEFEKLQSCEDYESIKKTMLDLDEATSNKKWSINFERLCKSMKL